MGRRKSIWELNDGLDNCRIPCDSSCLAQPIKMAMPSEQTLGMKGLATG